MFDDSDARNAAAAAAIQHVMLGISGARHRWADTVGDRAYRHSCQSVLVTVAAAAST